MVKINTIPVTDIDPVQNMFAVAFGSSTRRVPLEGLSVPAFI
jgi:hypothetical protein